MPINQNEPSDDYTLVVYQETELSLLVGYESDEQDDAVWIPRSRIEVGPVKSKCKGYDVREFTIPDWLAEKKDLV